MKKSCHYFNKPEKYNYQNNMKRLFYLATYMLMFFACTQTPQKKAEALIKESVLKSLYFPDSYEAVETKLDSAFSPFHDPTVVETILDLCKKGVELENLEFEMKQAKSSMSIWSGPYMTAFGKNEYNEAKAKFEEAKTKYNTLINKVQKISEGLKDQFERAPEFIGYKAHHRYRAKNNAGGVVMGDMAFFLNKDLTAVVAQWDEEEIEMYNAFLQQAAEAAELAQESE